MKDPNRPPTKIEQIIGTILSAFAALAFGSVAVFVLTSKPVSFPAAAIFSFFCLASVFMFFRAAFTARRALTHQEERGHALVLMIVGVLGTAVAVIWGSGLDRISLLGVSLSAIASGVAGRILRKR